MPVTSTKTRWSGGDLVIEDSSSTEIGRWSGTLGRLIEPNAAYQVRTRFTIAEVNAGATVLAALTGYKYRMVACTAIAVGGAAGAVTTVDILGTQSTSSVKLVAYAQASLTQSAVLNAGDSGAAVLADGASFVACDAGTAITIGKTGSNVTTATHIDIILTYGIDV